MSNEIRDAVRERYAAAATAVTNRAGRTALQIVDGAVNPEDCCGGTPDVDTAFGSSLYGADERGELPADAVAASLGCGNPTAVAELREGEKVLDLGSGGGIDVLLSARRVGPTGFAYGVDMTDEMLELAGANVAKAGAKNVEFLRGTIENVPLPDGSVNVVISNCVINLSTDKPAVLAEMFRVLTAGGRIGISDVVAEDHLTPEDRAARGSYVGCIAGALTRTEYLDGLTAAGFTEPEVSFTHEAAPGMHSAIIRATKPAQQAAEDLEWAPEACTLPTAARPLRVQEFDELFATALLAQHRSSPTVLTWSLARSAEQVVRDLTRRESECCSFFTFGIRLLGDVVEVTVEVPLDQVDVLDALQRRAG